MVVVIVGHAVVLAVGNAAAAVASRMVAAQMAWVKSQTELKACGEWGHLQYFVVCKIKFQNKELI